MKRNLFGMGVVIAVIALDLGSLWIHVRSAMPCVGLCASRLADEYKSVKTILKPEGYWISEEFHDLNYNVDQDGSRRTIGGGFYYKRTIWIFGNSSTFDLFVFDDETMASDLQGLAPHWRILNYGVSGQRVSGELELLKSREVVSGDIVIFLDGAMDVDTAIPRYQELIKQTEWYTHSKHAVFYHFVQPYIDNSCCSQMGRVLVSLPPDKFYDHSHLTPNGDKVVALEIYKMITDF